MGTIPTVTVNFYTHDMGALADEEIDTTQRPTEREDLILMCLGGSEGESLRLPVLLPSETLATVPLGATRDYPCRQVEADRYEGAP